MHTYIFPVLYFACGKLSGQCVHFLARLFVPNHVSLWFSEPCALPPIFHFSPFLHFVIYLHFPFIFVHFILFSLFQISNAASSDWPMRGSKKGGDWSALVMVVAHVAVVVLLLRWLPQ